jgi:SH3-like domain-containing protein
MALTTSASKTLLHAMKTKLPLACLVCFLTLPANPSIAAAAGAVAKEDRINVRALPSLSGEIITQLQKGEEVAVLEEITPAKPAPNEPSKWARIRMPANTPVWVFASFIEPESKAVKATRLNLRAGPGENFSVVGRLERGAKVNEIRIVEDWMEIEAPESAYAFVAANLLTESGAAPAQPMVSQPPPPQREPQIEQTTPPVVAVAPVPAVPLVQQIPEPAVPSSTPGILPAPTLPPPAVTPRKTAPEQVERIVRREGIVRSTVSIQAPTYYELLNPENRRTMNFLYAENTGLRLKDYLGRRIVVTGPEAVDPRWPRTPVIEVETLELISHGR